MAFWRAIPSSLLGNSSRQWISRGTGHTSFGFYFLIWLNQTWTSDWWHSSIWNDQQRSLCVSIKIVCKLLLSTFYVPGTGQIMIDTNLSADLSVWRDTREVPDGNKSYIIYVGGGGWKRSLVRFFKLWWKVLFSTAWFQCISCSTLAVNIHCGLMYNITTCTTNVQQNPNVCNHLIFHNTIS